MTSVDGMDDSLIEAIRAYQDAREKLLEIRNSRCPNNSVVYVECNKYTGHGIVKYDEDTPPEMVDVMLENGNIWRYPLEKVKPENNSTRWPRWIQELKFLKHNVVTRQIIIW